MLDKEFTKKWIEALRSGKYKQGHGQLCCGEHYCCLGVACEVAGLEKFQHGNTTAYGTHKHTLVAPTELEKYGLHSHVRLTKLGVSCVALNDAKHKTFEEIACALENELAE